MAITTNSSISVKALCFVFLCIERIYLIIKLIVFTFILYTAPPDSQDKYIVPFLGITKDIYDKKHQEQQDQIQTLGIEMSEHQKADYNYQTTVATVLSVARRAKTIFENSSEVAGKRAFLNYLLQNPIVTGKTLTFELKKPFDLVLNLANVQTKTAVISDNCPVWHAIAIDVRTFFINNSDVYIPVIYPTP